MAGEVGSRVALCVHPDRVSVNRRYIHATARPGVYRAFISGPDPGKETGTFGQIAGCSAVVLYNGSRRWDKSTELWDLIEDVPGGLSQYRPRFTFLLLDEGVYRDEDLKPLKNLVSALFRLENSRDPERIREVVTALLDWLAAPEQASLRRAFTVWFNRVFFPSRGKEMIPLNLKN